MVSLEALLEIGMSIIMTSLCLLLILHSWSQFFRCLNLTLWLWVRLLALRCHQQQHRHIDCLLAYIFTNCLSLGSASLEHTQSSGLALIRYFEKLKPIETLSLWINFYPRCFLSRYAQTLRLFYAHSVVFSTHSTHLAQLR